jgi:hypothetical protein
VAIERVIAERVMVFVHDAGEQEDAYVRVGAPVKIDDETWYCPYELRAGGHVKTMGMHGVDALQALDSAMKVLPAEIAHWERHRKGIFHFLGEEGAGI